MACMFYYVAVGICCLEGASGLLLSAALLYLLWRRTREAYFFRIPICVSAVHGVCINSLVILFAPCHIFRDGTYIMPFFGPLSPLIPRAACDIVMVLFSALGTMMWSLIPATATLQLIALSPNNWSTPRRLLVAYAFSIIVFIENMTVLPGLIPTSAFHAKLSADIRDMFLLEESTPLVVYGSSMKDVEINDGRSLIVLLFTMVMGPYTCSYILYGALAWQIRRKIQRIGAAQSERTVKTQRAAYLMHLLQGFVPLAIVSVPLSIFVISSVLEIDMGNATLIFTAFVWACPSVQASVQLRFVRQSCSQSTSPTRIASTKQEI